jgi:predicted nucleic acid-binding protein
VILVDTGFFFALASANDPHHERAREVFARFKGQDLSRLLITTNHVVAETITLTQAKIDHTAAVLMGEQLYNEKLARIHWSTPAEEKAAFAYLSRHRDKGYSFVDCLSFVVMDELGITEALAVDKHFTHSFTAHPGPLKG